MPGRHLLGHGWLSHMAGHGFQWMCALDRYFYIVLVLMVVINSSATARSTCLVTAKNHSWPCRSAIPIQLIDVYLTSSLTLFTCINVPCFRFPLFFIGLGPDTRLGLWAWEWGYLLFSYSSCVWLLSALLSLAHITESNLCESFVLSMRTCDCDSLGNATFCWMKQARK